MGTFRLVGKNNRLEWKKNVLEDGYYMNICPLNENHKVIRYPNYSGYVSEDYNKFELFWTDLDDLIVTPKFYTEYNASGLTGLYFYPTSIYCEKTQATHPAYAVHAYGWGGAVPENCGAQITKVCPGCGLQSFSPLTNDSGIFDSYSRDNTDFFFVWPFNSLYMLSDKSIEFLIDKGYQNYKLEAKGSWPIIPFGGSVHHLSTSFPKEIIHKMLLANPDIEPYLYDPRGKNYTNLDYEQLQLR